MKHTKALVAAGLILVLLSVAGGYKQGGKVAWAVEGRGIPSFHWSAILSEQEAGHLRQTEGLSHYMLGLLAEGQGDLESAEKEYAQARRYDPEGVQVTVRLGAVYLRMNNLVKAREAFEAACVLESSDPRPRFLLGMLYANEGRFEEAAAQYRQVLAQDPANLPALSQLADLYLLQENVQEGLGVYERFLKERPDSAVAHFNVGVLYAKTGKWNQAIQHLERTVELEPDNMEARLGLAVSYEQADRFQEAKAQFLQALALEPANARLVHHLANLAYRMGSLDEAADWLGRYLSFTPRDSGGYLELAYLRIEQNRMQEAVSLIKLALEFGNFEAPPVDLWVGVGTAYEMMKNYADAEAAYRRASIAAPEDVRPLYHLGAMYHRLGRFEEAEVVYRDAFRINPDDPQILNSLGYLYADAGVHLEEAKALLGRALSQDPENGAYLDSMGWIYFKMGRLDDALRLLEEASAKMPDPEVLEHLGQVYLTRGDLQAAKAAWERALKMKPKDSELLNRLGSDMKSLNKQTKRDKQERGTPSHRKDR